ncbi:hypothetical protein Dimus_032980 [Dionaea muscipula]
MINHIKNASPNLYRTQLAITTIAKKERTIHSNLYSTVYIPQNPICINIRASQMSTKDPRIPLLPNEVDNRSKTSTPHLCKRGLALCHPQHPLAPFRPWQWKLEAMKHSL